MVYMRRIAPPTAAASGDTEKHCLAAILLVQVDKGNTSFIDALLDAGANVDGCFEPDCAKLDHANPPLVSMTLWVETARW